jgi:hypothetical protein
MTERQGASPREVARIFSVRPQFIYDLIASGRLASHACSRRSVVFIDEVRALIAERPSPKSPTRTNGASHELTT